LGFNDSGLGFSETVLFISKYDTTKYQWSFRGLLEMAWELSIMKSFAVLSRKLPTRYLREIQLKRLFLNRFGIKNRRCWPAGQAALGTRPKSPLELTPASLSTLV
jgi:hypothetical protein